jgi:hypothetical protein
MMDGREHLRAVRVDKPDIAAYDALLLREVAGE